jgi:hypothetical protein
VLLIIEEVRNPIQVAQKFDALDDRVLGGSEPLISPDKMVYVSTEIPQRRATGSQIES